MLQEMKMEQEFLDDFLPMVQETFGKTWFSSKSLSKHFQAKI
jgi:hypothetical protein